MFYWKYIDLDPTEVERIKQEYIRVLPNNNYFFQSLVIDNDTFMGMPLQRAVLIQVLPWGIGRIHVDHRPDQYGHQLAIQIPLFNCENSVTEMWDSKLRQRIKYTDNGQPYHNYDKSTCTKTTEFVLDKPVIWRTDVPHSVNNNSDKPRVAISLRFKKDPWHLIDESVHILS
jgi:hypothetical protein